MRTAPPASPARVPAPQTGHPFSARLRLATVERGAAGPARQVRHGRPSDPRRGQPRNAAPGRHGPAAR
jgi:hypothetical protein